MNYCRTATLPPSASSTCAWSAANARRCKTSPCEIARGTITGLLGPSGCGKTTLMRCIVGTQIVDVGHGHGAGPTGRIRGAAPPGRIHAAGPDHLQRPADRRQRPLLRVAVRLRRPGRRRRDRAGGADRSPHRVTAATSPAVSAPGCRWRARWSANPSCSCSTNPRSAWTRCCGSDLWEQFTDLARGGTTLLVSSHVMDEADHCGDLLLMREGHLGRPHHPDPTTRGHRMHVTGGSVSVHHQAQHHAPSRIGLRGYTATTDADPAPAGRRSSQRRDDPVGADPGHHA